MRVLVVNAGSSSLKLRLLDGDDDVLMSEDLGADRGDFDGVRARAVLAGVTGLVDAAGHRIVHGGNRFSAPVEVDQGVRRSLDGLAALAPLHQAAALAAIDLVGEVLPGVPSVACFDTAFHATMPAGAATYAVPLDWRVRLGIRRFGFHGLSHAYAARRAATLLGRPLDRLRIVTCHLGAGASLAAVAHGRSVDTTMGFTPLEGLVMATRSGTVDPGLILWLVNEVGMTTTEVGDALEHHSGLSALAGTPDMAAVVTGTAAGDPRARLGFDVYVHRVRSGIASMAAAMGGLDVLTFAGGVGEHASAVRAAVVDGLDFVGARLDAAANASAVPDADVSAGGSGVRTLVVEAREDLQIAADVRALLSGPGRPFP